MNDEIDVILQKYGKILYRIAMIYLKNETDVEDIIQDVMIKYFTNHKDFKDEEHEKNWLIRVTLNHCHNLKKSAWRRKVISLDKCNLEFETETQNEIFSVLDELNEKYKVVIQLFYFEDLSITQISKILGISEDNVKTRLKRARKMVEEKLEKGEILNG